MDPIKIRCSKIGNIMSLPKLKKDKEMGLLSEGAKTYVNEAIKEQLFGRKKEFSNKYTIKGIGQEDVAIDLFGRVTGDDSLVKNEQHFSNEFCTGTPDLITEDSIIDIKSSWDLWTFPLFEDKIKTKLYWWQLQGYMWLCDKQKAKLAYCLVDTPEALIEKEFNFRKFGVDEAEHNELLKTIVRDMTFGDIKEENRVKVFNIERDDEAIEQIKDRVEACRRYQEESLKFVK